MCKNFANGTSLAQNYLNKGYTPSLLDSTSPTIGLSNINIRVDSSLLICSFIRQNSVSNSNFFDLNSNGYIIVATGPLAASGGLYLYIF